MRLASDESIGSNDGEDNMIVDNNLLDLSKRSYSESSEDDDVNSSSDEERQQLNHLELIIVTYNTRSGSYGHTEGDSGNPLLNTSDSIEVNDTTELTDNYKYEFVMLCFDDYNVDRFLSKQGLVSDNHNNTTR